jgi:uncharacterized membrane protein YvbJ
MNCPSCGQENREGARFCVHCGAAVVTEILCASCGRSNPAGERFCGACGKRLAQAIAD